MLKTCLQPQVFALLLACFLIQASHGPYYTFFSIYAEDNGYSRSLIGQLWSLGVLAEVVVFYYMYRWLPRFGAKFLLVAAMLLTVIRWWLIAYYVEYLSILLFAQLLHAASYGLISCLGYSSYRWILLWQYSRAWAGAFCKHKFWSRWLAWQSGERVYLELNRAFLCVFIGDVYSLDRLDSVLMDC